MKPRDGYRIVKVASLNEVRPGDVIVYRSADGFDVEVERPIPPTPVEPVTDESYGNGRQATVIKFYGRTDDFGSRFLYVALDNGAKYWHVVTGGLKGLSWVDLVEKYNIESYEVIGRFPAGITD